MIIWSTQSKIQLQDIYDYIAIKSPQNAENVISEIVSFADSIPNMPYKYPKEPTFDDETIRFVPKWNYKIIYLIENEVITILSIFNTSQGLSVRISQ